MTAIGGQDERRYRRLLWAYPSGYRRLHGAEIVTTLLDMAESGHGRPTVGQAVHLVACGIRQRFRVPRRVLAVIGAVLSAATLGGLGAVTGNWLAWQAAAPVPSAAEMTALTSAAAGLPRPWLEPWRSAMNGPGMSGAVDGTGTYDPARVRTALSATGWQITSFVESTEVIGVGAGPGETKVPARALNFAATKGGLSLMGFTNTLVGGEYDGHTSLALDVTTDVTGAIRPSTVAGLLLGALGGWLLAAALAYRIRTADGHNRWTTSGLTALALTAAAVPAFVAYCEAYQIMVYDVHASSGQYVEYSISETIPMPVVLISTGVAALALVAAVLVANRRSEPELTPVSS
ncbi:hypothetical protein EV385_2607 [Krasilnikovia cinnamomea]|uniref:Uncharacterized protein n=1 Tax=Krasilnikovia cinnamomea TaxID=349313 RepID=A0A4Q7ZJZ2_9ACTN|nr:hypothetical protein [Krasilnikovia cinnamomea]RZU50821.1 hypothetical protein EV385_2607 [Krasilnikovia cinnamomea]